MRPSAARLRALAVVAGLAITTVAPTASAQWISLAGKPAPYGELSGWGWLFFGGAVVGAAVPMGFAGASALRGHSEIGRGAAAGLIVGGTVLGGASTAYFWWSEPSQVAFMATLLGGMGWGMAGVGIGAVATKNPRAPWIGGSMGYGFGAVLHGSVAAFGVADFKGGAAAQAVLGIVGSTGCLVDAIYVGGRERIATSICAGLSAAAAVHGIIAASIGDYAHHPPELKKRPRRRAQPIPWVTQDGGGITLAGVF